MSDLTAVIAELRGLLAKATPEPWWFDTYNTAFSGSGESAKQIFAIPDHPQDGSFDPEQVEERSRWYSESEANMRLSILLRNHASSLIEAAEENVNLKAEIAALRTRLADAQSQATRFASEAGQARLRIVDLERQLAEARKDTERLDWFERIPFAVTITKDLEQPKADSKPGLRQWIDQQMATDTAKEPANG